MTFLAGEESYAFSADQLAIEPDWRAAVAAAARTSDGFGPVRGFRRLHTRVFGAEVHPPLEVFPTTRSSSRSERSPGARGSTASRTTLRSSVDGLRIEAVPELAGRRLQRAHQPEQIVVRSLGSVPANRGRVGVALPVVVAPPRA